MTGTLLNVSTVIIESSLGLVLGKYLTEHLRDTVIEGFGVAHPGHWNAYDPQDGQHSYLDV
tara:strand:+ start:952 stop:1134 length:183 start_codon:yes stop_codon:yes gene_type:complete